MYTPNSRHDELLQDLKEHQIDIYGMVETNVCWAKIENQFRPNNRFKHAFEASKVSFSYNTHGIQHFDKRQPGGTLTIAINSFCHRSTLTGKDPSGLGRWSWIRIQGKSCCLQVITIYRPVQSTNVTGVYRQQQSYLMGNGISKCPRQLILDDLAKEIIKRKGIIGVNFLRAFLHNDDPNVFYEHILHGTKIGGENAMCFGADYFFASQPDPKRVEAA